MKSKSSIFFWVLYDVMILTVCLMLSALLAKNFILSDFLGVFKGNEFAIFALSVLPHVLVMSATHTYRVLWQYAGPYDYIKLALAPMFTTVLMIVVAMIFNNLAIGINVYIINLVLSLTFVVVPRLLVKLYVKLMENSKKMDRETADRARRVMIIGAGEAAQILISDIKRNSGFSNSKVVCVIDDDETKTSKFINGVEIVGTRHDIYSAAKKYAVDVIVFAIPSLGRNKRREILDLCAKTGCELKTMPSIDDVVNSKDDKELLNVSDVKIEDLLERLPIELDTENFSYLKNKVVMVTGGGGSIGSELCRQIVRHSPKQLIIFDVYENNAYDILNEIESKHPDVNVTALIGSVRDSKRLECVFQKYRPQIIYHAAAHKHVPLMEDSPNETIKNNVFGTYKTAQMADKYGVERFVLISTDKAVNPTNIMGASKRMCEMIVQSFSRKSKTEFVAVRFGNVLGSNGSVIPLFKKQIEEGGPVKVTHPDIIRYFMTIPEAVSLVLTAGAMAKGGEIFVLDMGKPVKILDLAKNMIRLMGYEVDRDIKIEFIGLRPGEKLFEELLMDEEGLKCTDNKLIHVGKPIEFDESWFAEKLKLLKSCMYDDSADIRHIVSEIVPTYKYKK